MHPERHRGRRLAAPPAPVGLENTREKPRRVSARPPGCLREEMLSRPARGTLGRSFGCVALEYFMAGWKCTRESWEPAPLSFLVLVPPRSSPDPPRRPKNCASPPLARGRDGGPPFPVKIDGGGRGPIAALIPGRRSADEQGRTCGPRRPRRGGGGWPSSKVPRRLRTGNDRVVRQVGQCVSSKPDRPGETDPAEPGELGDGTEHGLVYYNSIMTCGGLDLADAGRGASSLKGLNMANNFRRVGKEGTASGELVQKTKMAVWGP